MKTQNRNEKQLTVNLLFKTVPAAYSIQTKENLMLIKLRNQKAYTDALLAFKENQILKNLIIDYNQKVISGRFIITGIIQDLIPLVKGSLSLGLAQIIARSLKIDATNVSVLDLKISFNYAIIILKSNIIDKIGGHYIISDNITHLCMDIWKYSKVNFCKNCSDHNCSKEEECSKLRCAKCKGRHTTATCNSTKKICFRCFKHRNNLIANAKEHYATDGKCPSLVLKILASLRNAN